MRIVGITGVKFSGKDTFAKLLIEEDKNSRPMRTFSFAYMLKKTLQMVTNLSDEQVHGPKEIKEAIDVRWGKSPRKLMQLWGTEIGRAIHPLVWVRNVERQILEWAHELGEKDAQRAVALITDVRFINEGDFVRQYSGLVIGLLRDAAYTGICEEHASEQELWDIVRDFDVDNNGTLENLREGARSILKVLDDAEI